MGPLPHPCQAYWWRGTPSSGPTSESLPPGPSCEAAEDVGQFQLPQARPPAL